jgi:integrase
LQRGEILGLSWADVDLDEQKLKVRNSLQAINKKLTLAPPKSEESARTLRIPSRVVAALEARRVRQAEQRLKSGPRWLDTRMIFTNDIGGFVQPIMFHRVHKDVLKKAGLPEAVRIHALRYSAASLLLDDGAPLKMVSDLGHNSVNITADIYGHVFDSNKKELTDQMEAILTAKASE